MAKLFLKDHKEENLIKQKHEGEELYWRLHRTAEQQVFYHACRRTAVVIREAKLAGDKAVEFDSRFGKIRIGGYVVVNVKVKPFLGIHGKFMPEFTADDRYFGKIGIEGLPEKIAGIIETMKKWVQGLARVFAMFECAFSGLHILI